MSTAQQPLISLITWAERTYEGKPPCLNTLRKWAREALIQPAPQRHGRAYYVSPDARYTPARRR